MGENGVQEDVGMDLALPWELQSSSASLWGRSRSIQDVESVPGREERPSFKFYRTQEGAGLQTECGHAQPRSPGVGGYRAGSAAHGGAHPAPPQAFWFRRQFSPCSGSQCLSLYKAGLRLRRFSSKLKVDSKLKTTTKWIDSHCFQQPK